MADPNQLRYVILADKDPSVLSEVVSDLIHKGWQLHGDLKLQVIAEPSSITFAQLVYIQAMWKPDSTEA